MLKKKFFLPLAVVGAMIFSLGLYPAGAQEKEETPESCVKPAKGPITDKQNTPTPGSAHNPDRRDATIAKVGKPAPDFEASAYVNGGFKNIQLSDYRGQWVVLCFYPGDFTFV